jgi:hypothetical protein
VNFVVVGDALPALVQPPSVFFRRRHCLTLAGLTWPVAAGFEPCRTLVTEHCARRHCLSGC